MSEAHAAAAFLGRVMDGERVHALCSRSGGHFRSSFHTDPADMAARALALDDAGADVWVGAHPLTAAPPSGRGGADDVEGVGWLHADLDFAGEGHASGDLPNEVDTRAALAAFPLPPSIVVHTGHGLHVWWELDTEYETADGAALLARLHEGLRRCGLKPERADLASILRIPGTSNHKAEPVPVTIEVDTGAVYTESDLDSLPDVEGVRHPELLEPPSTGAHGVPFLTDTYNASEGAHAEALDLLKAAGWDIGRAGRAGVRHLTRPGKTPSEGTSATFGKVNPGVLKVFSPNAAPFVEGGIYDPSDVLRILKHEGDHTATEAVLRARGIVGASKYGAGLVDLGPVQERTPPHLLPDEFWTARADLAHIRQAADTYAVSPDALLHNLLARFAASRPPLYELPALRGGMGGSLNYYALLIGPSGAGKTQAARGAADLLPIGATDRRAMDLPIGSGEGMAEAYMGTEPEEREGKTVHVRKQVRDSVHFYADEGEAVVRQMERSGATVGEMLRRGWSGETLGQTNATQDRTRQVPRGEYRLALVMGLQPEVARDLLSDAVAGTPQRFLFASAIDPRIPYTPAEHPGRLVVPEPSTADTEAHKVTGRLTRCRLTIEDDIATEVRRSFVDQARGIGGAFDPLDSHRSLHLLKVAGLLSLLDGRLHITREDWTLSEMVWATSCAVRATVVAAVEAEDAHKEERRLEAHARREEVTTAARGSAPAKVERLAKRLARFVHEETKAGKAPADGLPWRSLVHRLKSTERALARPAIEHAIAVGWLIETDDRYRAGDSAPAEVTT